MTEPAVTTLPLFAADAAGRGPLARARNSDPVSSYWAARLAETSGKAARDRRACFIAVLAGEGRTSAEIAVVAGLDRHTAARRLPDLLAEPALLVQGAARVCRVKGTRAVTWWLTYTGAQAAAALGIARD